MSARDLPIEELLSLASGPGARTARVEAGAYVDPAVRLGDGTRVMHGAVVARGTEVAADVLIGARAVFAEAEDGERPARVEVGARIGAGAVVWAGVVIGAGARVRPGSVVTRSVPAGAVVEGHPAAPVAAPLAVAAAKG